MAYELKQAAELSQRIELTGRERLTVTGVEDVERFDELSVVMHTAAGVLVVSGGGPAHREAVPGRRGAAGGGTHRWAEL